MAYLKSSTRNWWVKNTFGCVLLHSMIKVFLMPLLLMSMLNSGRQQSVAIVHLAYRLDVNEYNGQRSVQLLVQGVGEL
jgi:hypothetical protein